MQAAREASLASICGVNSMHAQFHFAISSNLHRVVKVLLHPPRLPVFLRVCVCERERELTRTDDRQCAFCTFELCWHLRLHDGIMALMTTCRSSTTRYMPIFIVAITVYGESAANQIMAQVSSHAGIRVLEKGEW